MVRLVPDEITGEGSGASKAGRGVGVATPSQSRKVSAGRFIEKLLERVAKLTVGDPVTNHNLGPVINKAALDSMLAYIEVGKKEGRLIAGGNAPATADGGYFLEPTVFADVAPNAKLAQEEIFGPVLALIKVASFEEGRRWPTTPNTA